MHSTEYLYSKKKFKKNNVDYSLTQNRIWRFQHNYFHFDPLRGDLNVAGLQFQWDDGIFSITLGKRNPDGYRTAYFHPMARFYQ